MAPNPREALAMRTRRMLGTSAADGGDADWHPAALASRVVECFDAVQLAWTRRDAHELRPYVSDAMLTRIDSWFDGFEDLSQVNRIENLELEHATLARMEFGSAADEDRLVATVGFSARDWLEDVRTGAILDGRPDTDTRFDQQWTFVLDAERGWVVDTVESWSGALPHSPAAGRPAPESRTRAAVPGPEASRRPAAAPPPAPAPRTSPPAPARRTPSPPQRRRTPPRPDPALKPAPARAAPPVGPGPVQGRRGSVPGHPGAAPMAHPPTRTTSGGALRVTLVLLLCVAVVAGAARAGLSLGQSSVADRGDAERTRLQARQAIAGPAFRRAYSEAQAKGHAAGLARSRKAGRTRGTRQGRRSGRAEAQRRATARAGAATAAAAVAARARTATAAASPGATTPRR